MSKVLIVGWVSPRNTNKQAAALARRIGQAINSFASLGWHVSVLQNDWIGETSAERYKVIEEDNCRRIVYNVDSDKFLNPNNAILRRIATIYAVTFLGDRSSVWSSVIKKDNAFVDEYLKGFDLVISYTSPKAPIDLCAFLKEKFGSRWIADFQDNYDDGLSGSLIYFHKFWIKRKLKSCDLCVQVSPEWAEKDAKALAVKFVSIRHAVTKVYPLSTLKELDSKELRIFYSGNLSERDQSLDLFSQLIHHFKDASLKVVLAGPENLQSIFAKYIPAEKIEYLGWLTPDQLNQAIQQSDILLVVPWSKPGRLVIPSKMFEFLGYDKPIFICGNDTGAFPVLIEELTGTHDIKFDELQYNIEALQKAFQGDYGMLLTASKIIHPPIAAQDLANHYLEYL